MEDDIVVALTHQVKEEIVENYFYARRLVEEQIKYVKALAEQASILQNNLSMRFARIVDLMQEEQFARQFVQLMGLKEATFCGWLDRDSKYRNGVKLIKARGFTERSRFKKLLTESYRRLVTWNTNYKETYEELGEECQAVNYNLKAFEEKHDLLTIISFLKGMDVEMLNKKHFLGDNFSPSEIGSVEMRLRFEPIRMENFNLMPPVELPQPDSIQTQLAALADSVYGHSDGNLKGFIR